MRLRRALSLLAVPVLVAAAPVAVANAAPDTGIFSIAPAQESQVTAPPSVLPPLQVMNGTAQRLQVKIFAATLHQELSGAFTVREEPAQLAQARQALELGADAFTMEADSARTIGMRWRGAPDGERGSYLGVVVQGRPVTAADEAVGSNYRLLGTRFLRAPGPTTEDGDLKSGRVEAGPGKLLNFTERLENTGNVLSTPEETEVKVKRDGEVVAQGRIRTLAMLPKATVDLPVTLPKVLQKGAYRAIFTARFGDGRTQRTAHSFRVVSPGVLATPGNGVPTLSPSGVPGIPAALPAASPAHTGSSVPWLWILIAGGGLALATALLLSLRRERRLRAALRKRA
jgi:hypothetical protein